MELPLADDQGKRDVAVVWAEGGRDRRRRRRGRRRPAARQGADRRLLLVIDDDYEGGALQVVLAKASTFTKWEGLFVE